MFHTSCIFSSYIIPFPRMYPAPGVLLLWGNCIAEGKAFMQRTSLHGFEGPSLLCQLSQREETDMPFEGQGIGRIATIIEQRWKSTGPLNSRTYPSLPQCSREVSMRVDNLSEPIKSQLVFLGLSETQGIIIAQKNRILAIELSLFSVYLHTPIYFKERSLQIFSK